MSRSRFLFSVAAWLLATGASAFVSTSNPRATKSIEISSPSTTTTSLAMTSSEEGSFWDQFQKFWDDTLGGANAANPSSSSSNSNNYNSNNNADHGVYQIASLPVQSMKPGGLRLFLMLYLMGMQNTPQPKTWRAHQPTTAVSYDPLSGEEDETNKHVLEMYFHDQTALFRVRLLPSAVVLERQGYTPSTAYLMQETLLVDGIWNELQACATHDDVPDANRLVLLSPLAQTAMDQARDALSFG